MFAGNRPWQVASSFVEPVPIPEGAPDGAPLVCVSFSRAWLPVVLGAMLQLAQPAAWVAATDADRTAVLLDVQDLINRVGAAGDCAVPEFRFVACTLQYSTDGGDTWIDVPGWDTYAHDCFVGPAGPTGPTGPTGPPGGAGTGEPPTQAGTTQDQRACNIASFLASVVLKNALQSVVDNLNATAGYYNTVVGIVDLFAPLAPELALILLGGSILVNAVTAHTTAPYETALTDPSLWAALTCAIFNAIRAVGQVDDANFAAMVAAVRAVSYTDGDVITTLGDYLDGLGATGVEQLQQTGGYWEGDCEGCGSWCFAWDFTVTNGLWTVVHDGSWVTGQGWESGCSYGGINYVSIHWLAPFALTTTSYKVMFTASNVQGAGNRYLYLLLGGSTVASFALPSGIGADQIAPFVGTYTWDEIRVDVADGVCTPSTPDIVLGVQIAGDGVNPLGPNNCYF